MSIYHHGGFTRSGGVFSAIAKQLKLVNLKGVSRIMIQFDPFLEESKSTREFLFQLSTPKIAATNPKCALKTNIVCGRQPSEIKFILNEQAQANANSKEIKLLSNNLTLLELLKLCNQHITTLAPPEDTTSKIQTKLEKKQVSGAGKRIRKK